MGTCAICGGKLYWSGDFTFEDYDYEGEGLVSNWKCSNEDCNADVQFTVEDKVAEEKQMTRMFALVKEEHRKHHGVVINKPTRGTKFSAGYDLSIPVQVVLKPNEKKLVFTDVKAYMNDDEVLKIYPRSGLATKQGIILANIVPVIDKDYAYSDNDGNIGLCLWNTSEQLVILEAGQRVAQGIFEKYYITQDDEANETRTSGFGSTGTN